MSMSHPSELRNFLNSLGIHAKKSLSQNFLIDQNIINKIVATAEINPGDLVLEIGPGPGALTQVLLSSGAHVIAVEKDHVFAQELPRLSISEDSLEVFNEDIMTCPLEEILKKRLKPGQKAKVVSNLPYHLTTPIVTRLVKMRDYFSHIIVMVQEEMGRRMTGTIGTKDYGSLSLFLNYYSKTQYAFKVSRNCFFPSPKVDSAIVALELCQAPQVSVEDEYFIFVRQAFQQRRKMLRASLKKIYPSDIITQSLNQLSLDPQSRPERLSIEQFISLFESCKKNFLKLETPIEN